MKIAVSGKGGVGKTTLSSMLAGALALRGRTVIAVDADPDANLPSGLGVPDDERITPIADMDEMIAERTGSKRNYGGYFQLNPKVDDIPEQFARRIGNIHLLVLGGVSQGGGGCICPATALVKALLTHLILGRDDAVIMDMEAGIEHLGRATAESTDALVVVVNPAPWSVQTALRVQKLAGEIGLKKFFAVANRVTGPADLDEIQAQLGDIPLIGHIPYDPRLVHGIVTIADGGGIEPTEAFADHRANVEGILSELESLL